MPKKHYIVVILDLNSIPRESPFKENNEATAEHPVPYDYHSVKSIKEMVITLLAKEALPHHTNKFDFSQVLWSFKLYNSSLEINSRSSRSFQPLTLESIEAFEKQLDGYLKVSSQSAMKSDPNLNRVQFLSTSLKSVLGDLPWAEPGTGFDGTTIQGDCCNSIHALFRVPMAEAEVKDFIPNWTPASGSKGIMNELLPKAFYRKLKDLQIKLNFMDMWPAFAKQNEVSTWDGDVTRPMTMTKIAHYLGGKITPFTEISRGVYPELPSYGELLKHLLIEFNKPHVDTAQFLRRGMDRMEEFTKKRKYDFEEDMESEEGFSATAIENWCITGDLGVNQRHKNSTQRPSSNIIKDRRSAITQKYSEPNGKYKTSSPLIRHSIPARNSIRSASFISVNNPKKHLVIPMAMPKSSMNRYQKSRSQFTRPTEPTRPSKSPKPKKVRRNLFGVHASRDPKDMRTLLNLSHAYQSTFSRSPSLFKSPLSKASTSPRSNSRPSPFFAMARYHKMNSRRRLELNEEHEDKVVASTSRGACGTLPDYTDDLICHESLPGFSPRSNRINALLNLSHANESSFSRSPSLFKSPLSKASTSHSFSRPSPFFAMARSKKRNRQRRRELNEEHDENVVASTSRGACGTISDSPEDLLCPESPVYTPRTNRSNDSRNSSAGANGSVAVQESPELNKHDYSSSGLSGLGSISFYSNNSESLRSRAWESAGRKLLASRLSEPTSFSITHMDFVPSKRHSNERGNESEITFKSLM